MKSTINKNFSKGALVLMLALTLQSCLYKDYTRPELEETEHLYRTDNLPQDSISLADVSWKDMFKDQYLAQYIEEGLQNNLDIRVAIQQLLSLMHT